jgi:hypothetical protein
MFVENPVKQGVKFKGIRIELLVHVANPRVLVIPMKLQHVAGAVHDGLCTQERVNRRDHRRFDTDFAQRVLKKPVEVGGDQHADVAAANQRGDGAMGGRGDFSPLLPVLFHGLDIAMQDSTPFFGCRRKLLKQCRIIRIVSGLALIPLGPIRLIRDAFRTGNAPLRSIFRPRARGRSPAEPRTRPCSR